jgi:CheY-like chemotaxis protein
MPDGSPSAGKSVESPKILIVEDVNMNRRLMRHIINRVSPMGQIFEAENGIRALEQFKAVRPDIIFMDVQMPEMDGLAATRHIRDMELALNQDDATAPPTAASAAGKRVPIVALTAGVMKVEKDQCFEAGMDAYLSKPLEMDQIREVLTQFGLSG